MQRSWHNGVGSTFKYTGRFIGDAILNRISISFSIKLIIFSKIDVNQK
jgi:hypothetical protein